MKYRDSKEAPPQMAEMSGVMKEETKALAEWERREEGECTSFLDPSIPIYPPPSLSLPASIPSRT